MDIDKIIDKQRTLQIAFGFPIDTDDLRTKANLLYAYSVGAMKEIGETMDEFSWKPWASDVFINREQVISEVADTFLFLANMLATVSCEDKEFSNAVLAKQKKNEARATKTYTHKTNKCVACNRALDDFYTTAPIEEKSISLCPICEAK